MILKKPLLQDPYVAQVLTLASQMRLEKKAKGVTSSSDQIEDAIYEIRNQKLRVLRSRTQTQ